jgi:hypothetical protein
LPAQAQINGTVKVQEPGGLYEPTDIRWKWWNEMSKKVPKFEWKMPLNFYGKVLDAENQPVVGAVIQFTWTDLSLSGSSRTEVSSDGLGRFALIGKQGKRLVVNDIIKEGYYLSKTENAFSFEYAAFFEETYHQPDPNNPVIFRMRKQAEAEPLLHREGEITIGIGQAGVIRLDNQATVSVELLVNGDLSAKNWSARVSVPGGGIQISTEEFAFEAPSDGYQPSLDIDIKTPKPGDWVGIYEGGQFYIKTADGKYGIVKLQTVPGKTFMRYTFSVNPNPKSRNLEFDPAKVIKPTP